MSVNVYVLGGEDEQQEKKCNGPITGGETDLLIRVEREAKLTVRPFNSESVSLFKRITEN